MPDPLPIPVTCSFWGVAPDFCSSSALTSGIWVIDPLLSLLVPLPIPEPMLDPRCWVPWPIPETYSTAYWSWGEFSCFYSCSTLDSKLSRFNSVRSIPITLSFLGSSTASTSCLTSSVTSFSGLLSTSAITSCLTSYTTSVSGLNSSIASISGLNSISAIVSCLASSTGSVSS